MYKACGAKQKRRCYTLPVEWPPQSLTSCPHRLRPAAPVAPQAMAAQCKSLGILCRGFSYFADCALGSPAADACQLGQPLNGPRQYPYHPQVWLSTEP